MKIKSIVIAMIIFLAAAAIVWSAQKKMITYTWDRNIQVAPSAQYTINFDEHVAQFDFSASTSGAISVDTIGKTARLGNSAADSCGVLWYSRTNPLVAKCTDGKCDFGCGFRAYFDFRFSSTDISATSTTLGDGFTFAVINATNNSTSSRGGPGSGSMGELLCYAGTGSSGLGLRSPKFALEFDTYGNTGAMTANGCSSGRADPSNQLNHIALMFWGDNKTGNCTAGCTTCLQASYDDNIHGQCASSCTNPGPVNSAAGDGRGGYCQRTGGKVGSFNWMEDGQTHRVRVEVTRATEAVGGVYSYNIKAWVGCEEACCSGSTCTSCPENEITNFQNVFSPYINALFPPKINRTVQLSAADHANFEKMIFGFTQGTGGATQNIVISNFKIFYPCSVPCNFTINPTSRDHNPSASAGNTVAVSTDTGCPWTAASNNAWITITAGASGIGSGTVTYSVSANGTGSPRTGTITIAGKIFTVNQAAPPMCTLVANPIIVPYNSTTNLTWTITNGPANGSWTGSPGGTCGSFSNSTGGTCTTSARTTPGANTFTLTVSNANGSGNCSATIYVGCDNYRVWNGLGGTRDFYLNTGCRNNITNNSEITQTGNRLNPGGTITAYSSTGTCTTALGIVLNYNNAMNADIAINGGDADCQVNFTGNNTATDR